MLHPALRPALPALRELCQRFEVQELYLFGSAVTARFDAERSDVDALVAFPPGLDPLDRGQRILDLWDELEQLFGRRVDLVTPESIRNPIFQQELDETKELIYEPTQTQVAG